MLKTVTKMQIQIERQKQKHRKPSYVAICPATGKPHRWIPAGKILGEADIFELQASPYEEICQDCLGRKAEYEVAEK
jgi:hypothetical protein